MLFVAMAGAGALVTAAMIWTVLVFASLLRKVSRRSVTSTSDSSSPVDLPEVRATALSPRWKTAAGSTLVKSGASLRSVARLREEA